MSLFNAFVARTLLGLADHPAAEDRTVLGPAKNALLFELANPARNASPMLAGSYREVADAAGIIAELEISLGCRGSHDREHALPQALRRHAAGCQLLVVFGIVPIPHGRRVPRHIAVPRWLRVLLLGRLL
jgi:hypothetical protein